MSAGSLVAHPSTIAALVVLVANDHWAKARWPGLITGKLSDFAGLVFAPTLIVATMELLARRPLRARVTFATTLIVGIGFALVKTWAPATEVYRAWWGWLSHPIDAVIAVAHALAPSLCVASAGPHRVQIARDPTDLVALVALGVPVAIAKRARA